jgi:hypothetical protein
MIASVFAGGWLLCLAVLAVDLFRSGRSTVVAPLLLVAALFFSTYRVLLRWETLLAGVIGVIFFIPIKRYTLLPSALPFNLEPYRIVIALVALGWASSLLVDRRVRLRRSGLEGPILLFVFTALASVAVNGARIQSLGVSSVVVKTLTFWASFFVLFYLVVSVVKTRAMLDGVIRVLVGCGAVVAVCALIESWTRVNVFNYLGYALPGLNFNNPAVAAGLSASYLDRAGRLRVYASAAHPIELGATLTMLTPLAVYLLKSTGRRRWLLAAFLLVLGTLATLSRTGVIMLIVVALVFLWLRPAETRRLWPAVVPAICAIYFALPHTLGSFYAAFFPKGGIVAEQTQRADLGAGAAAEGRLTRIGPSIAEWSRRPLLGEGFGSRVTAVNDAVAPAGVTLSKILDDQWLGSLLETGLVGVIALLWLFTRSIRRMARVARDDRDADGWLAVALASSFFAFAVGMLTFDALGFVQVTIVLFVLLAFGSALLALRQGSSGPEAGSELGGDPTAPEAPQVLDDVSRAPSTHWHVYEHADQGAEDDAHHRADPRRDQQVPHDRGRDGD